MQRGQQRHHPYAVGQKDDYGKVVEAAGSGAAADADVKLKDPKGREIPQGILGSTRRQDQPARWSTAST